MSLDIGIVGLPNVGRPSLYELRNDSTLFTVNSPGGLLWL